MAIAMPRVVDRDALKVAKPFEGLLAQLRRMPILDMKPREDAKHVVFWHGPGIMRIPLMIETVLGRALMNRGERVTFVLCDGVLNACTARRLKGGAPPEKWPELCKACYGSGKAILDAAGIPHVPFSKYVSHNEMEQLREEAESIDISQRVDYQKNGINTGHKAETSLLRFLQGKEPEEIEGGMDRARQFLLAALISETVARHALDDLAPELLVMLHGFYVDWGPVFEHAMARNLRVVRYMGGYQANALFYKSATPEDRRHMYNSRRSTYEEQLATPFGEPQFRRLSAFLNLQSTSKSVRLKLFNRGPEPPEALRQRLDLPANRPVWALFAHLNYEGFFSISNHHFTSALEWLLKTVEAVWDQDDVTWLIKTHPVERTLNAVETTESILKKKYGQLPEHIRLLTPDMEVNSYGLLAVLDGAITLGGTIGLEAAAVGLPAIASDAAHYSGWGFNYAFSSTEEYFALLRRCKDTPKLTQEKIERALHYAYLFFVRRQIPFPWLHLDGDRLSIQFNSLTELDPGRDELLKVILDRMLDGAEVVLTEATLN